MRCERSGLTVDMRAGDRFTFVEPNVAEVVCAACGAKTHARRANGAAALVIFDHQRDQAAEGAKDWQATYQQAIRVLHHGLRQAVREEIREATAGDVDVVHHWAAVAMGYAFALEVLTRRSAPDHFAAGWRWVVEHDELSTLAGAIAPLLDEAMRSFPSAPHVVYEND